MRVCAFWVLIQKILKKDPPFLFFPLVGGGCGTQRLCVCVQGVLCGLSFRFCVRSDQIKKFEMESPPRRKRRRAHTHNTYRERERECRHYVAALVLAPSVCVCVCVRVCSDVPFAVDFSLSQIGKMVLALWIEGVVVVVCCNRKGKHNKRETSRRQTHKNNDDL